MEYTFNDGSLSFEGTWYNIKTGDKVVVRDTLFENNQIIIRTTDGRMISYDKFQDYVKSDKPLNMTQNQNRKQLQENIPQNVLEEIQSNTLEDFDNKMLNAPDVTQPTQEPKVVRGSYIMNNIYESSPISVQEPKSNVEQLIVARALDSYPKPKVNISIDWDIPRDTINMLLNVMNINKNDIYLYYKSFLNTDMFIEEFSKKLADIIDGLENHPSVPAQPAEPAGKEETVTTETVSDKTPEPSKDAVKPQPKKPGRPKKNK